jgi:spoIIIJ-associated protein
LDQLGVAVGDAEVIVIAEPKTGLFGRVRGEARVRARVQPIGPRPKRTRRPRDRGRAQDSSANGGSRNGQGGGGERRTSGNGASGSSSRSGEGNGRSRSARRRRSQSGGGSNRDGAGRTSGGSQGGRAPQKSSQAKEEIGMAEGMTLQEQAEVAREFLEGLLEHYGLEGTVDTRVIDDETVEVAAKGDLGLLVGPKGSTLAALQDVTRTVVQRNFPSRTDRIMVDVAGYREKRAMALQRFSRQVADEVIASSEERALEPMSPADRKVVHDAVGAMDGVATRSEGEDPARYIVISPAG